MNVSHYLRFRLRIKLHSRHNKIYKFFSILAHKSKIILLCYSSIHLVWYHNTAIIQISLTNIKWNRGDCVCRTIRWKFIKRWKKKKTMRKIAFEYDPIVDNRPISSSFIFIIWFIYCFWCLQFRAASTKRALINRSFFIFNLKSDRFCELQQQQQKKRNNACVFAFLVDNIVAFCQLMVFIVFANLYSLPPADLLLHSIWLAVTIRIYVSVCADQSTRKSMKWIRSFIDHHFLCGWIALRDHFHKFEQMMMVLWFPLFCHTIHVIWNGYIDIVRLLSSLSNQTQTFGFVIYTNV